MTDVAPVPVPDIPAVLAADLVAAWAELTNVTKTKTANAGTYTYAYADLGDLLDVARPILAKHNLALIQPLRRMGSAVVTISTTLVHTSGHTLVWEFDVQAGNSPQQTGSAITYGRRYSSASALGVAFDGDDDDGKAAAPPVVTPRAHTPPRRVPRAKSPREALTRRAMAMFTDAGLGDRADRLDYTSAVLGRTVDSWSDVTDGEGADVIAALSDLLAERSGGFGDEPDVDPLEDDPSTLLADAFDEMTGQRDA